jgi:hypothetical protein
MKKINYESLAKKAKTAGLYLGPTKNFTKHYRAKLRKIVSVIPSLLSTSNNYRSVKVPDAEREAFQARGFKTFKDRVIINMEGATRLSYSKRFKAITAYGDTDTMYKRNRYTLDGDLDKMMALADENNTLISFTQGSEGQLGAVFSRDELLRYTEELKQRLEGSGKSYVPAITEITRRQKSRGKLTRRNRVPKEWKFDAEDFEE